VLIDTAGLQASDPALRMQLESLAGRGIKAKITWCLQPPAKNKFLPLRTIATSAAAWPDASSPSSTKPRAWARY